jgi:hypothetical protein
MTTKTDIVPSAEQKALATKETHAFGVSTVERSAELAAIAVAAAAQAEVEAAYKMAIMHPRHEENARTKIVEACRNPSFAAKARYRKPVGKKEVPEGSGKWVQQFIEGPSIRFAEEMLRHWKNVLTQQVSLYDDAIKRLVRITTRDLESNTAYSKEITLDKTVERRSNRDREVLGQRVNSNNQIVYIVRATEDELTIKESALASKVIRTNGLRLIPQHIVDEAMQTCADIIRDKAAKDPAGERRKLLDGFARKGVTPMEIERLLGAPAAQFTPDDLVKLHDMLNAIEDGHSTWQEFVDGTPAQVSEQIADKSQVDTKGAAIAGKLADVQTERGAPAMPVPPAPAAQQEPEEVIDLSELREDPNPPPHTLTASQQAARAADSPPPASDLSTASTGADSSAELSTHITAAEAALKATDAGLRKYNAILGLLKVRLTKGQTPLSVIPAARHREYLGHLQDAITSLKK